MINRGAAKIKLPHKHYWAMLLVLFGLALFSGISIVWIAFWFSLMLAFGSAAWLLILSKDLEFSLGIKPLETMRNGYVELELRVLNDSFLPLPHSELYIDGYRGEGHFQNPEQKLDEKMEFDDNYPLGSWRMHCRIKCTKRGYHSIGPFRLRLQTLFGALAVEKIYPGSKEFVVYPRAIAFSGRYHIESVEPSGVRRNAFNNPFNQLDYTESYDLRPFVPGDPYKIISWKISARQNEIYVKRPDTTNQSKVVVCLEFSQQYYYSTADQDLSLEKLFSLLTHLLFNGFQVGLATYDGKARYLPPARGKRQLNLIRKLFTDLQSGCMETLLEKSFYKRRAANDKILWVMPNLDHSYLKGLANFKKYGTKPSLITTCQQIPVEYDSIFSQFYIWQLFLQNNRVSVRQVETS